MTSNSPNTFFFLEQMGRFIQDTESDGECLIRGLPIRRPGPRLQVAKERQVTAAEHLLDEGRISEREFLCQVRSALDLRSVAELPVLNDASVTEDNETDAAAAMAAVGPGPDGGAVGLLPPNENGESLLCVLCLEDARDACIIPCGHKRICIGCAGERVSEGTGCPACGSRIDSFIKVLA